MCTTFGVSWQRWFTRPYHRRHTHQAPQKAILAIQHTVYSDTLLLASSPRDVWAFIREHSSWTRTGNSLRGAAQEWLDWCSSGKRPTSLIPSHPNEVRGTPPIVFYLTTCSARLAEVGGSSSCVWVVCLSELRRAIIESHNTHRTVALCV